MMATVYNPCDIKIYLDDYELDCLQPFKNLGSDTLILYDSYLGEVTVAISPVSYETYKLLYDSSLTDQSFRMTTLHKDNLIFNCKCKVIQCSKMMICVDEHPSQFYSFKIIERFPL